MSTVHHIFLHIFNSFCMELNSFGIAHEYRHQPMHDPDQFVSLGDLASRLPLAAPLADHTPPWPWANMTGQMHGYGYMWVWVGVCPSDTPAHTHTFGVGMGWSIYPWFHGYVPQMGIFWGMSFTNEFKMTMALFEKPWVDYSQMSSRWPWPCWRYPLGGSKSLTYVIYCHTI